MSQGTIKLEGSLDLVTQAALLMRNIVEWFAAKIMSVG
ncbi:MAG: hypothetical protein OFPI_24710 [Osedax symbiont Rs2]|nr:MAG: hypothetical protein OFPI_24710 [Osedax symbiont Rs2]